MKILNISQQDWANFQYDNMKALRSVGIYCDSVVIQSHPFYKEQSKVIPSINHLCLLIQEYDIIQFFHDNLGLYNSIRRAFGNKKVIVYHTSSIYRLNSAVINHSMKLHAYRSVNAMPEFMGLGAKNAVYMVGAIDTDKLYWNENNGGGFGHYPSNAKVKGTDKIVELMKSIEVPLTYSIDVVDYETQIKRMRSCRVYIEMFTKHDANGMPYGNFGITALEAAAMGIPVITNCRDWGVYYGVYGKLPFIVANDEKEFIKQVTLFYSCPPVYENIFSESVRNLIIKNHSYKATGEYFLKNVL